MLPGVLLHVIEAARPIYFTLQPPFSHKIREAVDNLLLPLNHLLDPGPCGHCDSCVLRANGFAEAGIEDPALRR